MSFDFGQAKKDFHFSIKKLSDVTPIFVIYFFVSVGELCGSFLTNH